MAEQNINDNGSNSSMFIVGLALGTLITALITPKRGSDLRRSIKNRVGSMKESAGKTAERVDSKVQEKAQQVKDITSREKSKAQNAT